MFLISNQTFKELSMEKKNENRKTTSKTEIQFFFIYLESGKWAKPTHKMNKQNLNNFALNRDTIQWRAKSYGLGAY